MHCIHNQFLYLFPLGYGSKTALLSSAGWLVVNTFLIRQDRLLHAGCRESGLGQRRKDKIVKETQRKPKKWDIE